MCECGCGEQYNPVVYFPGPAGTTYGIAVGEGCQSCETPAGFGLLRIPDSELEHFGIGGRHDPPWVACHGWHEWFVPMVRPEEVRKAMTARLADEDLMHLTLNDAIEIGLSHGVVCDAVRQTIAPAMREADRAPASPEVPRV